MTEQRNKLRNKNLSISTNYIICVDVTNLGGKWDLLLFVDISSRCIVGHALVKGSMDSRTVCDTLTKIVNDRRFLPSVSIVHTDKGSIFTNEAFLQCLESLNIQHSVCVAASHQNQVIERLNRTIKNIIRKKLNPSWTEKAKLNDPLKVTLLDPDDFKQVVHHSIEHYNNKEHSAIFSLTPNQMEVATFEKHGNQHPKDIALYTKADISQEAQRLIAYKAELAEAHKADWPAFFIQWKEQQEAQYKNIIETLEIKFKTLYEQYLEVQQKLAFLEKQALDRQEAEQKRLETLDKKKNAKKLKLRDTVNPEEFQYILSLVKGRSYARERRIVALTLLYLTGLRVSNLLEFTKRHLEELISNGWTYIPLIKGGEQRFPLRLSSQGKNVLLAVDNECLALLRNKNSDQPLFTPAEDLLRPMRRDLFDKELNHILQIASNKLGKHIRTHSFRATLITELLHSTPIDQVKDIVGHRSIASTLEYKRTSLTNRQALQILARRDLKDLTKQLNTKKDVAELERTPKRPRGRPRKLV